MTPKPLALLKKLRWLLVLLLAPCFAAFVAHHTLAMFLIATVIFSILGLLFLYHKAHVLIFFILSLLPSLTTELLLYKHASFTWIDQFIFLSLFFFCLIFSWCFALKLKIISTPKRASFPLLTIIFGLLLLFILSYLSTKIGAHFHTHTTENQAALDQLRSSIPLYIFAIQTIFAGFFEELTYRTAIFEIVFKQNKILAFICAALLFTLMHAPTNVYSWFVYGSMSLVLTSFYAKYRNFYLNMSIHMLWNTLGILRLLL